MPQPSQCDISQNKISLCNFELNSICTSISKHVIIPAHANYSLISSINLQAKFVIQYLMAIFTSLTGIENDFSKSY